MQSTKMSLWGRKAKRNLGVLRLLHQISHWELVELRCLDKGIGKWLMPQVHLDLQGLFVRLINQTS